MLPTTDGTVVKAGTTYVDDRIVEVRGTTKSEFAELYKDFGYGDDESIIARDPGRLALLLRRFRQRLPSHSGRRQ